MQSDEVQVWWRKRIEKTSGLDKQHKQISALSGQPLDTIQYFIWINFKCCRAIWSTVFLLQSVSKMKRQCALTWNKMITITWCTKTSCPPSSGVMNPQPFATLNHLHRPRRVTPVTALPLAPAAPANNKCSVSRYRCARAPPSPYAFASLNTSLTPLCDHRTHLSFICY